MPGKACGMFAGGLPCINKPGPKKRRKKTRSDCSQRVNGDINLQPESDRSRHPPTYPHHDLPGQNPLR